MKSVIAQFVLVTIISCILNKVVSAQQAPACPYTDANYGPFDGADIKLIQEACDPYSIITMQQFCRACTCAINRGLLTSLERAGSLVGNLTARKAFTEVAAGNKTVSQVPGLQNCGPLETDVMLKNKAMTRETVSVSSTCWNLGADFLLSVYASCDYSPAPSQTSGERPVEYYQSLMLVALTAAFAIVV